MDANDGNEIRRGGSIERADRHSQDARSAPVAGNQPSGRLPWRYELHDPFAETTYRLNSLSEIIRKAEDLGSSRFQFVEDDGSRVQVDKIDGQWRRRDGRELVSEPESGNQLRHDSTRGQPGRAQAAAEVQARMDSETARLEYIRKLEERLHERYVIKNAPVRLGALTIGQTEYRFRGNTSRVAFTERTFKLSTDDNNPAVARSMVDVAEAREWHALRVSGHEEFCRAVWIEATLRGVKTVGYEATLADLDRLQRERESRQHNRVEPAQRNGAPRGAESPGPASGRGSGGRKTVLAALEAVLVAKGVPPKPREAVMAAAAQSLSQRMRDGELHKVKVYDPAAPSHAPAFVRSPEVQRSRERAAPAR